MPAVDPKEMPWPSGSERLFTEGGPFSLEARTSIRFDFHLYAQGYRESAERLFASILSETPRKVAHDVLLFPLAFLWRQYLELALKGIAEHIARLDGRSYEIPPKGRHNLMKLWGLVKPRLEEFWPASETHGHIESMIKQFDEVDRASDAFRYPYAIDGTPNAKRLPKFISLSALHESMVRLANALDGTMEQIEVWTQSQPGPGDF